MSPATPLLSDIEVRSLFQAAHKARNHFALLCGQSPAQLILDTEFKLTTAHGIVFKQACPYTPTSPSLQAQP